MSNNNGKNNHKNNNDKKQKVELKQKNLKINYKKKYDDSQKEIKNLNNKIKELIIDNNNNIKTFQSKAKGFQKKAQEELDKIKEDLTLKAQYDSSEIKKYGAQKLLESILDPINNIDVAIQTGKTQQNDVKVIAYVQGFEMLMEQLFQEFENNGLEIISPTVGDEYDPELHQAITINNDNANIIVEVKKKGFKLHDRVIKPAVIVLGL